MSNTKGYIVNYFIQSTTAGIIQFMLIDEKDINSDEVVFHLGTVRVNDDTTEGLLQGFLSAQPVMVQKDEFRTDKRDENKGITSEAFAQRFANLSNYELMPFGVPDILEKVRNDRYLDKLLSKDELKAQEKRRRNESFLKDELDKEAKETSHRDMLDRIIKTFAIFDTDVAVMKTVGDTVKNSQAILNEALTHSQVELLQDNVATMLQEDYILNNYNIEMQRVSRFLEELERFADFSNLHD